MKQKFKRPEALTDIPFHFCPGCHHGIIHRLVAECIDLYGLREKTIGVASVGCSVFLYDYFNLDVLEAPHGRAAAVATGVKRASPDKFVFTYQGDGDLAAIGTAEIIHAANRGEHMTVIFVNNTVYGMTGGQMAPTTMPGQETTTTPFGRELGTNGFPIKMAELLTELPGTTFIARGAVNDPKNLMKARKLLQRAFEVQINGEGFSFVELLSACPTNWKMSPQQAALRVREEMVPYFPLGIFKGGRE
jgi:2-oxoglutarate ferredoxin oxidoreductase subunit beta